MAEFEEPIFDVAQLAHVEILTPKPDETLWFFKDLLALEETERFGQSVYLRAYEDSYHHTLKVTEAAEAGMGHCAWRASSPQALGRRVRALEDSGAGKGWTDGDRGHGPAYQFETPDGHGMEILWEVDYAQIPEEKKSVLINRPQKRPLRGVPVRRLVDGGGEAGAWLSVSPLVHEVALMGDQTGARGRFHHVCFWYGIPQHNSDAAEVFSEYGVQIEAGPGKHGISQALFMYVFEPGGNRVELFGDAGYLIFDPAWKPVTWTEATLEQGIIFYGSPLPAEFFLYGTPPVGDQEGGSLVKEEAEELEEVRGS